MLQPSPNSIFILVCPYKCIQGCIHMDIIVMLILSFFFFFGETIWEGTSVGFTRAIIKG